MMEDQILKMYVEEDRPFLHFKERIGKVARSTRILQLYVADSKQSIAIFFYEQGKGWVEGLESAPREGRRIPVGFEKAIEGWGGRE